MQPALGTPDVEALFSELRGYLFPHGFNKMSRRRAQFFVCLAFCKVNARRAATGAHAPYARSAVALGVVLDRIAVLVGRS